MNVIIDFLKIIGKYLLLVVGGTTLFLILSPVAGYVPYSDRPGPGWHGKPFEITWRGFLGNAGDMLGFGIFLSLYAVFSAAILYILVRLLEKFCVHKVAVAAISAILSGLLSSYILAAIGWYIAIGFAAIIVSLILGIIFGVFVLPKNRIIAQKAP